MSWLDKVTTPPAILFNSTHNLEPLLTKDNGNDSKLVLWKKHRSQLRQDWLKILGPLPQAPSDGFKLRTVSEEHLSTFSRTLVRYAAEPGRFVNAYILRPAGDIHTVRPGVVAFHPTNKESIKVVAGTGGRPDQHLALPLVEHGFVVICPENFINEKTTWNEAVAAARIRHPDSTGMATMLADGMRSVDVLSTFPGVDPTRIGAIGHSLGAKQVLYLMAFDARVAAGVFSEGGIGLNFSNWDANWYLGPQTKSVKFKHDHHELLGLIAPRPLLIFGGETGRAADGDRTWPYITAANHVYQLYGEPTRLGFINHHEGHTFPPPMADKAIEWLDTYLHSN